MKRTMIKRIPIEVSNELFNIKSTEKLKTESESFMRMAEYSRIGREIAQRDLLHANVKWFNIKLRGKKR